MGDYPSQQNRTTITCNRDLKEQLDSEYRVGTWDQYLETLMNILPTVDKIKDGCVQCGHEPRSFDRLDELCGVIQFFNTTYNDGERFYGANYFCSTECADEMQQHMNAQVPTEPAKVRVGGHHEMVTEFSDARFYLDGMTKEVGIDIPGAFGGMDSHGNEYDYIGEPVYIQNEHGKWVQDGVITDIIHEETHTGLILEDEWQVTALNHPNEERRKTYDELHTEWYDVECPSCEAELRICESWENDEYKDVHCHECDAELAVGEDNVSIA